MPTKPHLALGPTAPENNGDEMPPPPADATVNVRDLGNSWWRVGKQLGATGAIISLAFWMFSEIAGIMRHFVNNQSAQHESMVESNKAIERHVATQIEVTRELSATVKESTFVMRANLAATERLELVLKLFGWPLGAGKKEKGE